MLDAYIIDQIKRREQEKQDKMYRQPVIEYPILPEDSEDEENPNQDKDRPDRDVIIIELNCKSLENTISEE